MPHLFLSFQTALTLIFVVIHHRLTVLILRIALHPRNPHQALEQQKKMIRELKDQGYTIATYSDLIPKLKEAPYTII